MRKLGYIVDKINALSEWSGKVLSLLILVMIGTMMCEIIARYVFNHPTMWGFEASTMICSTFMLGAGAYTLRHEAHVKMDIFYTRWSKRTRAIVDVCTFPLFFFFCSMLLWKSVVYGWQSCVRLEHATTAWGPPIYPWKMVIPLSVLLIMLQGTGKFIRDIVFIICNEEEVVK